MRQGDFAIAENLWREALNADTEHIKSRLELSYSLYKQRKIVQAYDEALLIAQPKEPLTETPSVEEVSRAWALLGSSLLGAGNFKGANESLLRSLTYNPDEPLALASAALLDFYENRANTGIIKLRRAIFLEPREPDFVFALAQVAARTEKYKEAADAYERFLRIAPDTDVDRRERIKGLINFLRYLGTRKALYEPKGELETRISCEIVNNRPIINVRVNGDAKPLRFVLDTGSGMTVISDETAASLGLKPIARGGKARAVGGTGKFEIVYGFLTSLDIGSTRISNVPVYIRKFHNATDKFDGYLGLSVIAKFLTTIDYGKSTFSIVRQGEVKRKKAEGRNEPIMTNQISGVPFRNTSSGFLSSEVKLEGAEVPLNFILDTGASISVVDTVAAREFQMNRFAQTELMRVFGAAGVTENVVSLNLPSISLGGNTQQKISAAVLDLSVVNETAGFEQAGILGGNFLKNYRVTFDFRNSMVKLEPTNMPPPINAIDKMSISETLPKKH
jgi:predicted aspartyl protease